jgi:hypothetical protein
LVPGRRAVVGRAVEVADARAGARPLLDRRDAGAAVLRAAAFVRVVFVVVRRVVAAAFAARPLAVLAALRARPAAFLAAVPARATAAAAFRARLAAAFRARLMADAFAARPDALRRREEATARFLAVVERLAPCAAVFRRLPPEAFRFAIPDPFSRVEPGSTYLDSYR